MSPQQVVGWDPQSGQPVMVAAPPAPDPGNFSQYRTQMRESPEDIWQPVGRKAVGALAA